MSQNTSLSSSSSSKTSSAGSAAPRGRRIWLWIIGSLVVLFVLMQFVRFLIPDLRLDNPPVTQTIAWDSPQTQALFTQACADCHSNETVYPWYSWVAPMGWLVARDVHEGRREVNISQPGEIGGDEMVEEIRDGKMPMPIYLPLHPEARLTSEQQQQLISGIEATFR